MQLTEGNKLVVVPAFEADSKATALAAAAGTSCIWLNLMRLSLVLQVCNHTLPAVRHIVSFTCVGGKAMAASWWQGGAGLLYFLQVP
jgi:hypothetical protein